MFFLFMLLPLILALIMAIELVIYYEIRIIKLKKLIKKKSELDETLYEYLCRDITRDSEIIEYGPSFIIASVFVFLIIAIPIVLDV